MKRNILLLCAFLTISWGVHSQNFTVTRKIALPDDGSWDYCFSDDATGRLYVSHDTEVLVVDGTSGKVLAKLTGLDHVHGIAVAPELGKGFISSGDDNTVLVFDLNTYQEIKRIKTTGDDPDCILYDPFTQRVFTCNGHSSNSTVINAKDLSILGTIPLDGKPEFAQSTGDGLIYVNIEDKSEITVIDPSAMKVLHVWSISPGEAPSGLALDIKTHRLFSVCDNAMMVVVNAENGHVITTVPTGDHTDACTFDPESKLVFASNGNSATLSVIQEVDANTFKLVGNVKTEYGAKTSCLNRKTHHIFLPTADFSPAPAPTADNAKPRPQRVPGTFHLLEVAPN